MCHSFLFTVGLLLLGLAHPLILAVLGQKWEGGGPNFCKLYRGGPVRACRQCLNLAADQPGARQGFF